MLPALVRNALPWWVRNTIRINQQRFAKAAYDAFWTCQPPAATDKHLTTRLGSPNVPWLFIAGMNNSGTTLLVRMLARSGIFRSLPREGHFLTPYLGFPQGRATSLTRIFTIATEQFRLTEATPGP